MNKPHQKSDPKIKAKTPKQPLDKKNPVAIPKPPSSHQPQPEIIEACLKGRKAVNKNRKSKSRLTIGIFI